MGVNATIGESHREYFGKSYFESNDERDLRNKQAIDKQIWYQEL